MKISATVEGAWIAKRGVAVFKPLTDKDLKLFEALFMKKQEREDRLQQKMPINLIVDLPFANKTFKQLKAAFALITVLFQLQEEGFRKPTEDEKYDLYLDVLEEYGLKKVSSQNPNVIRPIHLSEANTFECAHLITVLFDLVAEHIGFATDLQADVRVLFFAWEAWRGEQDQDPLDYADVEMTITSTEKEWRKRHPVSDASGLGGELQIAHIVSRGSDSADIEEPWNWLALTHEEHADQHQHGWEPFLFKYPHLKGRIDRARELAKKLPLDMR